MKILVWNVPRDYGNWIGGPADLNIATAGWGITIFGDPTLEDHGRWAAAIGMAALRGATIQKGQTA